MNFLVAFQFSIFYVKCCKDEKLVEFNEFLFDDKCFEGEKLILYKQAAYNLCSYTITKEQQKFHQNNKRQNVKKLILIKLDNHFSDGIIKMMVLSKEIPITSQRHRILITLSIYSQEIPKNY